MLKKNNNPFSLHRLRRATWLPLLALAWLQLAAANHQFDHVADYFSDSCHVCVQLDRIDDSTVDHSRSQDAVPTPVQKPATAVRDAVPNAPLTAFNPRAPPRL